jgi:hypothetical protein
MVASSRAHAYADTRSPVTHMPQRRGNPCFGEFVLPTNVGLDEGKDAGDQGTTCIGLSISHAVMHGVDDVCVSENEVLFFSRAVCDIRQKACCLFACCVSENCQEESS